MIIVSLQFSKSSTFKSFSFLTECTSVVFKFFSFEERLQRAPLRGRLVWTVGVTVELGTFRLDCEYEMECARVRFLSFEPVTFIEPSLFMLILGRDGIKWVCDLMM